MGHARLKTPTQFLAEPDYEYLIIQSPNDIEPRWRVEIQVKGNMYSGYGENGYHALCVAVKRFRDTDPEAPGIQTMTIDPDRKPVDNGTDSP